MKRRALLLALLLAACARGGVVVERDGEGALFSSPQVAWGAWYEGRHSGVGETWSFGSARLCLTAPGLRPVVRSLEPASVEGQVRVEPIAIRTALRPPPTGSDPPGWYAEMYEQIPIITMTRQTPRGLHDPDGWVVRTDCEYWNTVSEIVVTMTKTGPKGGGIDGIVVTYSLDGQLHRFTIAVTFGICGTAAWDVCWGREDVADASDPSTPATTAG